MGLGLSHPATLFFPKCCVGNTSHLGLATSGCSHAYPVPQGDSERPSRRRRLGKKRPFKHERQEGVWSGFERGFVT